MALSFKNDILPLFRPVDVEHMKVHGVLLDSYEYMSNPADNHANARAVRDTLLGPTPRMPPGGPYWSGAQVDVLTQWITEGCAP
jgi:hypothetical protein